MLVAHQYYTLQQKTNNHLKSALFLSLSFLFLTLSLIPSLPFPWQVEDILPPVFSVTPKGSGAGYGVGFDLDELLNQSFTELQPSDLRERSVKNLITNCIPRMLIPVCVLQLNWLNMSIYLILCWIVNQVSNCLSAVSQYA